MEMNRGACCCAERCQRLAVDVYVTVFGVLHDFVDRPGRAAEWTLGFDNAEWTLPHFR
jgi:hypothetical protein